MMHIAGGIILAWFIIGIGLPLLGLAVAGIARYWKVVAVAIGVIGWLIIVRSN